MSTAPPLHAPGRFSTASLPVLNPAFPRLQAPLEAGRLRLRNRSAISAHFAGWFIDGGLPTRGYADYLEHRCAHGVGLFVVGGSVPAYAGGPDWLQNTSAGVVPGYQMLAEAAHRHGAKLFAQLLYIHDDLPAPADDRVRAGMLASAPRPPRRRAAPPERSPAELRGLAAAFGAAAARAAEAGVDGHELHAHEGFLHAQFLSPKWNRRTDGYGGGLVNRLRFTLECLEAMRAAVGDAVPLGLRLKADDDEPGGMGPEDYAEAASRVEASGLVDYLSLTGGDGGGHHGPMARPDGEWLDAVATVRAATTLPVMHAGRITTPELAEETLAAGTADVICLTKAHIADPAFTAKVYEGRTDAIRLCTRCLQNCIGSMEEMSCVYHPTTSRERAWANPVRAEAPKKLLVVGGGPAGIHLAEAAARRGHDVTVWERSERVGGRARLAAAAPHRRLFGRIAEHHAFLAGSGRFEVSLGREATADGVLAGGFDAVAVATGGTPARGPVPGDPAPSLPVVTPDDVLAGRVDLTGVRRALVRDRVGGYPGMCAADALLAAGGIEVHWATPLPLVGWHMDWLSREATLPKLLAQGLVAHDDHDLLHLNGRDARLSTPSGEAVTLPGLDLLVLADGTEPRRGLFDALTAAVTGAPDAPSLHLLGDAHRPGDVYDATFAAEALADRLGAAAHAKIPESESD